MPTIRIAFVTCSTKPDFAPDDLEVVHALNLRGVPVQAIPWDSNFTDWNSFDLVVLRSCWNYHLHPQNFLSWLDNLEANQVNLLNPVSTVRWNLHKKYLAELDRQGVRLPPTQWFTKGANVNLKELLQQEGWNKAVVKPAISATAHNTFVVSVEDVEQHQPIMNQLLDQSDLLIQQFVPEIEQGEYSLIFFHKKFSHAILKKPKPGDFRVQHDFGGAYSFIEPPDKLIKQAESILTHIKEPLLYARVDGVMVHGQFLLMELELIEPVLFFQQAPYAVGTFVDLLLSNYSAI
jgi:glutathione synthase/RimK-type ligase-like ATP-grasp enzyme